MAREAAEKHAFETWLENNGEQHVGDKNIFKRRWYEKRTV